MTTATLIRELRLLGQVEVPQASLERGLRRVLAAHPVPEADSPVSPCGGIAGHTPFRLPNGPRLRVGSPGGG